MKKVIYLLIPIIIIIVSIITIKLIIPKPIKSADAIKFKEEYESLNNQTKEDRTYQAIEIPTDNPIKYATINDIIEIFDKKESAILYIGYPECPWCRKAIPILLETAKKAGTQEILYLNITEYNNKYSIIDGQVVKVKEEKEGYYELLKLLEKVEREYVLKDGENAYPVNELRIYSPTVLKIVNGEIESYRNSVIRLEEGKTVEDNFTEEQISEIEKEYMEILK